MVNVGIIDRSELTVFGIRRQVPGYTQIGQYVAKFYDWGFVAKIAVVRCRFLEEPRE